ncbi:hypothetical protein J2X60_002366, partial [Curtobacterium sp. 320]|nr:hypothetical protein [Curtobacterium sp. 320]
MAASASRNPSKTEMSVPSGFASVVT